MHYGSFLAIFFMKANHHLCKLFLLWKNKNNYAPLFLHFHIHHIPQQSSKLFILYLKSCDSTLSAQCFDVNLDLWITFNISYFFSLLKYKMRNVSILVMILHIGNSSNNCLLWRNFLKENKWFAHLFFKCWLDGWLKIWQEYLLRLDIDKSDVAEWNIIKCKL